MVSPNRKIARFFRRNYGIRFNPLFAGNIRCGAIVDIDGSTDIDFVSNLADFGEALPEVQHSEAHFADVNSLKEMSFAEGKRFDLGDAIPLEGEVKAMIESANEISLSFGPVEMSYINQVPTDIMIRKVLAGEHRRLIKSYLRDHDNHVVVAVYRAPVELHFRSESQGDLSLLSRFETKISSNSGLTWVKVSETSLQSESPVTFGFETARWRAASKRLRSTS